MLELHLAGEKTSFLPGEELTGRVTYAGGETEPSVCLLFYTQGRGTDYTEIVASQSWITRGGQSSHDFLFELPEAPYSFSGKLITLRYRIEAVAGNETAVTEITSSPTGSEITLVGVNK